MKTKEILRKAIDRAQANGFKLDNKKHAIAIENNIMGWSTEDARVLGYESIIFDHDFAKAFFPMDDWQHHLSTMVLEEEPLKYLEKFL